MFLMVLNESLGHGMGISCMACDVASLAAENDLAEQARRSKQASVRWRSTDFGQKPAIFGRRSLKITSETSRSTVLACASCLSF